MEANRNSKKGTFLDRTWRDTSENPLENPNLSRGQKFKQGGYSIPNLIENYQTNLYYKYLKLDFLKS